MEFDDPPDESEHFLGRSISRVIILNDQTVKAVWKEEQLKKYIFPSFQRVFQALGFHKVDWWDLLTKVAFGGDIYLMGAKSTEPPSYTEKTIEHILKSQRTLAQSLLNQVFNKEDNLAYFSEVTTILVERTLIKVDPGASTWAQIVFRALDLPDKATYRVIIEGNKGGDTHLFRFQPSVSWLCSRFPQNLS